MSSEIKIPTNHCAECNGNLPLHSDDDHFYGSPIRSCPYCGKKYMNKHYHEPEIEGFQETNTSKKAAMKEVLFYGAVVLVVLIVVIVLMLIKLKMTFKVLKGIRKRELEKELQASVKRLENKEYARILKELSYQVPENICKWIKMIVKYE